MLKLKFQYFVHLMQRTDSLEKTLMLGKTEGRRRGWQRVRWLDGITDLMGMSLSRLQELAMDREAWVCWHQWGHKVLDTTVQVKSRTLKIPFSSKDPHPLISKIRNLGMLLDFFPLPTLYGMCIQSCLTFCSPMDCSPPGSSVPGIFQTKMLEWVAISPSRGFSYPLCSNPFPYPANSTSHTSCEFIYFFPLSPAQPKAISSLEHNNLLTSLYPSAFPYPQKAIRTIKPRKFFLNEIFITIFPLFKTFSEFPLSLEGRWNSWTESI